MRTIYLETSFISYLTARPSRTILGAARQEMSRDWWTYRRMEFELRISELVIRECAAGDQNAALQRLNAIAGIPRLAINKQVEQIALNLIQRGLIPPRVAEDALHIAIAAVHGMDFVLTWNFKHIANSEMQYRIANVLDEFGFILPFICTPDALLGEDYNAIN